MLKSLIIKEGERTNEFYDLGEYGYFQRSSIRDVMAETYNIILRKFKPLDEDTDDNKINYYNHEKISDIILIIYHSNNKIILAMCSSKIGKITIRKFLSNLILCQNKKDEDDLLNNFNINYSNMEDKLDKINTKIDDTKDILIKNINELIERGEKIDDLLIRSDHLSNGSILFIKRAKKINSCCTIL